MLQAVSTAIEIETDGRECYMAAAKESNNQAGRNLLLSLAEEEEQHRAEFEKIYDAVSKEKGWPDIEPVLGNSRKIKDTLVRTCRAMGADISGNETEIELIKEAIEKEKKSYEFYKERAEQASYESEKNFYSAVANEEWDHALTLSDYYDYLFDPASWFLNIEHPSLDGG